MAFNVVMLGLLLTTFTSSCHSMEFKDGKMSFETPKMTEEEQHSRHIPANLACDACKVVSYQLTKNLENAEKKYSGKALKESEYLDVFENTCKGDTFENYGIKNVDGVNRLTGEGLEAADIPGMSQGGGKWPGRLVEKCFSLVGDIGEDEIYELFRKGKPLFNYFCKEHTKDCLSSSKKKTEL